MTGIIIQPTHTHTMKIKTKNILAEDEGEYSTAEVFQAGKSFFKGTRNGGDRGSHSVNSRFPDYLDGPHEITRDQALAECARLGVDEVDIDE